MPVPVTVCQWQPQAEPEGLLGQALAGSGPKAAAAVGDCQWAPNGSQPEDASGSHGASGSLPAMLSLLVSM